MATSFHSHVNRENISSSALKNSDLKGPQGQRNLSAKTFHEQTPRKALGDLGNVPELGHSNISTLYHLLYREAETGSVKFQTPRDKSSKVKIFDETPKTSQKKSMRSKKGTFSTNAPKVNCKIAETKLKPSSDACLPDIEKMVPFIDQENELPTPQPIERLLQHPRIINSSLLIPPREHITDEDDDTQTFPSKLEFDPVREPFDDTLADILGHDGKLELCEVETTSVVDFLLSLDDIPLDDAPLLHL